MSSRKRSNSQESERGEQSNRNSISRRGGYGASIAALILVAALLIFQTVTFICSKYSTQEPVSKEKAISHKSQKSTRRTPGNVRENHDWSNRNELAKTTPFEPFPFNPNTVTIESLQLLGFTPRQAQTIINWRSKGGVFRKKEDFKRIYSVSPEKYEQLKEFIVIAHPADSDSAYRPGRRTNNTASTLAASTDSNSRFKPYAGRSDTIDLNFADSADLTSLRGIGGYYANQIMAYRQRLGYFYCPEQLLEIPGIDSSRFAQLRSRITVSLPHAHENNSVTYPAASTAPDSMQGAESSLSISDFRQPLCEMEPKQMASHPYIGAYLARSFIVIKKKYGAAALTLENLLHQGVISLELARKLSHYFR